MILRTATVLLCLAAPALAEDNPFAGGWTLKADGSTLGFQSVKNETKVEQSGFATFAGEIAPTGDATIRVALDSVDTKIDLRNVRMRFLFFQTFKFPEAVITAHLDPALLADLPTKRRLTLTLPYTLNLHGVSRQMSTDVVVTLISDNLIDVASIGTIPVAATDFDLDSGVAKLQEAANVKIVPTGSVTFDWLFERAGTAGTTTATTTTAPATTATTAPAATTTATTTTATTAPATTTTAIETTGNFDPEACAGRFDILSHAGNINFRSASATLNVAGSAILNDLVDIITRCPGMRVEVGGHTDDNGADATNLALSQKRAAAVVAYLVSKGIAADRLAAHGYGEASPLVLNDTKDNMARNRRIEFKTLN